MKLNDCEVGMKVAVYSLVGRRVDTIKYVSGGRVFTTNGASGYCPEQLRKIKEKKSRTFNNIFIVLDREDGFSFDIFENKDQAISCAATRRNKAMSEVRDTNIVVIKIHYNGKSETVWKEGKYSVS